MNLNRNRDLLGVWVGVTVAMLGLAAVVIPGLSGMDMMDSGYAMIFVGIFVILSGIIIAVVFGQRAREMARILAGENVLARWTYSEEQSRRQVQDAFGTYRAFNRSTFLIVFAWFMVIGAAFLVVEWFVSGEFNGFFALLFFGVLPVIALAAFAAPILWRRQAAASSREVIIARRGVVLNGALHTWAPPLNRLAGVAWSSTPGERALEFEIRYLSRTSLTQTSDYTLVVPVPPGMEAQAQQALDYFQGAG